jgi:hypothetical protein
MTIPKITPRYRVLDSTLDQSEETKEMIGGEFKRHTKYDFDKTISLWSKDKLDHWYFNDSDVVELTPLEFEGKSIAIGDDVKCGGEWLKVYDYYWFDGRWRVVGVLNNDYEEGCDSFCIKQITGIRQQLPKDTKNQKALAKIKELEEKLAELKKEVGA